MVVESTMGMGSRASTLSIRSTMGIEGTPKVEVYNGCEVKLRA